MRRINAGLNALAIAADEGKTEGLARRREADQAVCDATFAGRRDIRTAIIRAAHVGGRWVLRARITRATKSAIAVHMALDGLEISFGEWYGRSDR